ncbi:hypothetical protein HDV01_006187 [Terramyces sp. JEL0728]|nr:hypothetical protein HDV01_006187 [Terramyces sp. JEL0728]
MSSSLAGIPKFDSKPAQDFDDFDDILSLSSDSDKLSKKSSIKSKKSVNETKLSNVALDKSNFSLAVNTKPTLMDSIKEKKGVKSVLDSLMGDGIKKEAETTKPGDDFGTSLFQEASNRRRPPPPKKEEGTDDEMLDILGFGNEKPNTKSNLFGSKSESSGEKKDALSNSKADISGHQKKASNDILDSSKSNTRGHQKKASNDIFTNSDMFGPKPANSIFANTKEESLFASKPADSLFKPADNIFNAKQESFNSKKPERPKSDKSVPGKQDKDDDIPSFLQEASSRRRGRGSIMTNDTNSNSLASQPSKITADSINFLDYIKADKTTKDLVPDATVTSKSDPPKLGILDILDKQLPLKPDKKIKLHKNSDSSSIAMLSDTDEASSPLAASFKTNSKKSSMKSKSSFVKESKDNGLVNELETKLKIALNDLENLKNDLKEEKLKLQEKETKSKKEMLDLEHTLKFENEQETAALKKERDDALHKVESVGKEYEQKLQVQEALHKQRLEEYAANIAKSDKLNHLVGKVETTNEQMAQLQSKFNHTYEENLKARQESILQKESLLANLQQQLQKESQELEKERQKAGILLEKLETNIKESNERLEQERINSQKEKTSLQSGMVEFEQTRDSILFSLNQEKASFENERHQWDQDRKKLLHKINQDRKEISIQKAQLSSQERRQTQLFEQQSQQLKSNQNQFQAEYNIFEQDRLDLSNKTIELNKQALIFNTEKLKLENKEKEVVVAMQVLEEEKQGIVKKLDLISKNRDYAVAEKQNNLQVLRNIEMKKKEIEEQRYMYQSDLEQYKQKRKEYFNDRINWSRKQSYKPRYSVRSGEINPAHALRDPETVKEVWADKPIDDIQKDFKIARQINNWTKEEQDLAAELELKVDSFLMQHERVSCIKIGIKE